MLYIQIIKYLQMEYNRKEIITIRQHLTKCFSKQLISKFFKLDLFLLENLPITNWMKKGSEVPKRTFEDFYQGRLPPLFKKNSLRHNENKPERDTISNKKIILREKLANTLSDEIHKSGFKEIKISNPEKAYELLSETIIEVTNKFLGMLFNFK